MKYAIAIATFFCASSALATTYNVTAPCPADQSDQPCQWQFSDDGSAKVWKAEGAVAPQPAPVQPPAAPVVQPPCVSCVDPQAGKFCGLHWCVWLLLGALAALTLIILWMVQRKRAAYWMGQYNAGADEEHILLGRGATRDELVAVRRKINAAWAMVQTVLQPLRGLGLGPAQATQSPNHVAPAALPPAAPAAVVPAAAPAAPAPGGAP